LEVCIIVDPYVDEVILSDAVAGGWASAYST